MENKNSVEEFEDMINKAKLNAYSKESLKNPLSKSGLEDYKGAFCDYYGFSKEELQGALGK